MTIFFPLYANITGKCCVVVGGGPVAERKVNDLLEAGAHVRVVSPKVTEQLQIQAQHGIIEWQSIHYTPATIRDAWLVFAATNVRTVNAQVTQDAHELHLFVNVADEAEEGSFIVPSVVRRGDLCLSVSTGGANPILTRKIAEELLGLYGQEYGLLVELLGQLRAYIKASTDIPELRRQALSELIRHEVALRDLLRAGELQNARTQAETIVNSVLTEERG